MSQNYTIPTSYLIWQYRLSYRKRGLYYLLHNILSSFYVLSGTPFSRMLNHIYWSSNFLISPIFLFLSYCTFVPLSERSPPFYLPIILLKFIFLMSKSSFLLQNCSFFHSILFLFYEHKNLSYLVVFYTLCIYSYIDVQQPQIPPIQHSYLYEKLLSCFSHPEMECISFLFWI